MLYILTRRHRSIPDKSGQTFVGEYVFAVLIFTMTLFIFYKIHPTIRQDMDESFSGVSMDAKTIAEIFSGKGYPANWTVSDVKRIGVMGNRKNLSENKIRYFWNLTRDNYDLAKSVLNIHSDFIVYFENMSRQPTDINGTYVIGKPEIGIDGNGTNISSITVNNLVQVRRTVMYRKKPINAVVIAWD